MAPEARARLLRQANALLDAGLPDDALNAFDAILKVNPNDGDARAGREKASALRAGSPRD